MHSWGSSRLGWLGCCLSSLYQAVSRRRFVLRTLLDRPDDADRVAVAVADLAQRPARVLDHVLAQEVAALVRVLLKMVGVGLGQDVVGLVLDGIGQVGFEAVEEIERVGLALVDVDAQNPHARRLSLSVSASQSS